MAIRQKPCRSCNLVRARDAEDVWRVDMTSLRSVTPQGADGHVATIPNETWTV